MMTVVMTSPIELAVLDELTGWVLTGVDVETAETTEEGVDELLPGSGMTL